MTHVVRHANYQGSLTRPLPSFLRPTVSNLRPKFCKMHFLADSINFKCIERKVFWIQSRSVCIEQTLLWLQFIWALACAQVLMCISLIHRVKRKVDHTKWHRCAARVHFFLLTADFFLVSFEMLKCKKFETCFTKGWWFQNRICAMLDVVELLRFCDCFWFSSVKPPFHYWKTLKIKAASLANLPWQFWANWFVFCFCQTCKITYIFIAGHRHLAHDSIVAWQWLLCANCVCRPSNEWLVFFTNACWALNQTFGPWWFMGCMHVAAGLSFGSVRTLWSFARSGKTTYQQPGGWLRSVF